MWISHEYTYALAWRGGMQWGAGGREHFYFLFFLCSVFLAAHGSSLVVTRGLSCPVACGILVPWPGIKPEPPAVEAWSPSHWTTREFISPFSYLKIKYFTCHLDDMIFLTNQATLEETDKYHRQLGKDKVIIRRGSLYIKNKNRITKLKKINWCQIICWHHEMCLCRNGLISVRNNASRHNTKILNVNDKRTH